MGLRARVAQCSVAQCGAEEPKFSDETACLAVASVQTNDGLRARVAQRGLSF